ncbi:solute carrier family 35 member D3 [Platysternon megacephalum]|uniref:Solute carrier family 35 member D3 n=1 Tax=Platysternon megacephalum TaxID=55544 RepID=A0A4D9ERB6_9SAUR|nr:solute carrier family 35 member D3 [Platysternon megacephalum]
MQKVGSSKNPPAQPAPLDGKSKRHLLSTSQAPSCAVAGTGVSALHRAIPFYREQCCFLQSEPANRGAQILHSVTSDDFSIVPLEFNDKELCLIEMREYYAFMKKLAQQREKMFSRLHPKQGTGIGHFRQVPSPSKLLSGRAASGILNNRLLLKLLRWGWLTSCSCTSVPACSGIVTSVSQLLSTGEWNLPMMKRYVISLFFFFF